MGSEEALKGNQEALKDNEEALRGVKESWGMLKVVGWHDRAIERR